MLSTLACYLRRFANSHPSSRLHAQTCSSFTNSHLQKFTWTFNISGELLCKSCGSLARQDHAMADGALQAVFVFPFTILKSLRFSQFRDKLGLALVFSLGLVTIVTTSLRFVYMCLFVNDISLCEPYATVAADSFHHQHRHQAYTHRQTSGRPPSCPYP